MSYLKFLQLLISLGPKLQLVWPAIQKVITAFQELFALLKPEEAPGGLSVVEVTDKEAAVEEQAAALIAGPNAAFDGSILRAIWSFLQTVPALMELLAKLLEQFKPKV